MNSINDGLMQTSFGNVSGTVASAFENTQVLARYEGESNSLDKSYIYGNERISEKTSKKSSEEFSESASSLLDYIYDARGSVTENYNNNKLTRSLSYDPYGEIVAGNTSYESFYGYNSEEYDPNTGLSYLRARYLDLSQGGFIQEDNYLGDILNSIGLNVYSYAFNNPVKDYIYQENEDAYNEDTALIDSVNIFSALTGISSLSAQSNRFAQSVTQNRQKARTVEAEAENATEYNSRIIEAQEESFRPGRQSVTAVQEASQSASTAVEKSNLNYGSISSHNEYKISKASDPKVKLAVGADGNLEGAKTPVVRGGATGSGESAAYRGGSGFGNYQFKEGVDIDLRGKGTYKDALDIAFDKTGLSKDQFTVTKWGKNEYGKSFPVEWKANNGAEVNIDIGHSPSGEAPTVPHIGWQTGGKRGGSGGVRGHIFVDDVPYNR